MLGFVMLGWVATVACSNSNNSSNGTANAGTGGNSTAGTSGSGGGASGNAGNTSNGGVAGASGAANGREEVWVDASNIMSCDDVCAAEGDECAAVCGDNNTTAADTLYTYYSSSGLNLNQQRQFNVCATPVSGVLEYGGNEYLLVTLRCCCLALPVTRIDGDPTQPVNCTQLCATHGLVCNPETNWDGLATSGLMATYKTIDGQRYIPGACNDVPALTVNKIGNDEPLTAYRCGCVAP